MKTSVRRQWSKFDACQFERELAASELATTDSTDVDYLFQLYDDTTRTLLDKHARGGPIQPASATEARVLLEQ